MEVCSRWGGGYYGDHRVVDTNIKRLRGRLKGRFIVTRRGFVYRQYFKQPALKTYYLVVARLYGERLVKELLGRYEFELERIWTPFYKVDRSGSRKFGGTGLGLAIAGEILKKHNFTYGARNRPGGVEFYFSFPLENKPAFQ